MLWLSVSKFQASAIPGFSSGLDTLCENGQELVVQGLGRPPTKGKIEITRLVSGLGSRALRFRVFF